MHCNCVNCRKWKSQKVLSVSSVRLYWIFTGLVSADVFLSACSTVQKGHVTVKQAKQCKNSTVHRCHGSVRTSVRGSRIDTISVQQGKKTNKSTMLLFCYFEQTVVQITIFIHGCEYTKYYYIMLYIYIYIYIYRHTHTQVIHSWNIFDFVYS